MASQSHSNRSGGDYAVPPLPKKQYESDLKRKARQEARMAEAAQRLALMFPRSGEYPDDDEYDDRPY